MGFGASFGYTVMARISLFINRIQDVDQWGQYAFNATIEPNVNYHGGFQAVFWGLALVVVGYIVLEIMKTVKAKNAPAK
jgi:hypothetical protein